MSEYAGQISTNSIVAAGLDIGVNSAVFGIEGAALAGISTGLQKVENIMQSLDIMSTDFARYISPLGSIGYWNKIYDTIKNSNQQLGIAGSLSKSIEANTIGAYQEIVKYGGEIDDIVESYNNLNDVSGRNINFTKEELESLSKINTVLGKNVSQIQKYSIESGKNVLQLESMLNNMVKESGDMGINLSKAYDNLIQDIKVLDEFSFKNGLKGITKMAMNAERMRISVQSAMNATDSFLNIDDGIENVSQMQMLGGEFASQFGDIFQVTFDARNNPEAIQKRLFDLTKSIATFNKESGEIYIDPYNMDRLRVAAKTLNVELSDLVQSAKASFKEQSIENLFSYEIKNKSNFEEIKSLVAGMATMVDNKWSINVEGQQKTIAQLDETDLNLLRPYEEASRDYLEDIALSNKSIKDSIDIFIRSLLSRGINDDMYTMVDNKLENSLKNFDEILQSRGMQSTLNTTNEMMRISTENFINVLESDGGLMGVMKEMGSNLNPFKNAPSWLPDWLSPPDWLGGFNSGETLNENSILKSEIPSNEIKLTKINENKLMNNISKNTKENVNTNNINVNGEVIIKNEDGTIIKESNLFDKITKMVEINIEKNIKNSLEQAPMFNSGKSTEN